jgi:hypothetical protein
MEAAARFGAAWLAAIALVALSGCASSSQPRGPKPHEASDYLLCVSQVRPGVSESDRRIGAEQVRARNLDCRPFVASILTEYNAQAGAQAQRDAATTSFGLQMLRQGQAPMPALPMPAPASDTRVYNFNGRTMTCTTSPGYTNCY